MDTLDVTCPDCGATRGVGCRVATWGSVKRASAHDARTELAASWRSLFRLGTELGVGSQDCGPDLDDAEHLLRFGEDDERDLARRVLALAERLGYREPGDEEAA